MWRLEDLVLYTGSVYGLAWLLTRSKLSFGLRGRLADVPFVGSLSRCIACMSAWVAMAVLVVAPWSTVLSAAFRVASPVDAMLLVGWSLFATWTLGRVLGDAD